MFTVPSMLIFAHAVLPAAGFILLLIPQVEQCGELRIGHRDYVAAVAAIAAVRPAARDKLFTPKADAAAPSIAGFDFDRGFVNELHGPTGCRKGRLFQVPHPFVSSSASHGQKKSPERGFSVLR
jgi:hypothetical protein